MPTDTVRITLRVMIGDEPQDDAVTFAIPTPAADIVFLLPEPYRAPFEDVASDPSHVAAADPRGVAAIVIEADARLPVAAEEAILACQEVVQAHLAQGHFVSLDISA